MKTAELTGADLDYWVAKAEGFKIERLHRGEYCDFDGLCIIREGRMPSEIGSHYSPSKWFSDGGPIIDREQIRLSVSDDGVWYAERRMFEDGSRAFTTCYDKAFIERGPTTLIAAMRAYVASKFGDDVPDESQFGIKPDLPQAK